MSLSDVPLIGSIISLLFPEADSGTEPEGADAVRTALRELESLAEKETVAVLEEPEIIRDVEAEFFDDPKIKITLRDVPFGLNPELVFDLDDPKFKLLLDGFDLDLDSLEELDGQEVPIAFVHGNPVVNWPEIAAEEQPDEGGETEGDDGDEGGDSGSGDDCSEPDVTVEERTVNASPDDALADGGDDDA